MRKAIRWLRSQEDLIVGLIFGGLTLAGVLINSAAFYASPMPAGEAVPPLFREPERFVGQPDAYIEAVIVRRLSPDLVEVVPLAGGMRQQDPRLLVALGPGARQARLRSEAQEVYFYGVVLRGPESVPPDTLLTPEAEQLVKEGALFYYARRM